MLSAPLGPAGRIIDVIDPTGKGAGLIRYRSCLLATLVLASGLAAAQPNGMTYEEAYNEWLEGHPEEEPAEISAIIKAVNKLGDMPDGL